MNNTIENYFKSAEKHHPKKVDPTNIGEYYKSSMEVINAMSDLINDENIPVYLPITDTDMLVIQEEDRIYIPMYIKENMYNGKTTQTTAKAIFDLVQDSEHFYGVVVNPGYNSSIVFEDWMLIATLIKKHADSFSIHDENGKLKTKLW